MMHAGEGWLLSTNFANVSFPKKAPIVGSHPAPATNSILTQSIFGFEQRRRGTQLNNRPLAKHASR
jgi:hypothetical protein